MKRFVNAGRSLSSAHVSRSQRTLSLHKIADCYFNIEIKYQESLQDFAVRNGLQALLSNLLCSLLYCQSHCLGAHVFQCSLLYC